MPERSGPMKKDKLDVARAWRDEDYFQSLSEEERASLGAHPSGAAPLQDEVLRSITGGCCSSIDPCAGPTCKTTYACSFCYPCA
jgi:mersacidin/lichenicidin family type 2 lantibiotic